MKVNKDVLVKAGLALGGVAISLASAFVGEKDKTKQINKAVEEALQKQQESK